MFGADGLFSSGFFGWCPFDNDFKVAHIEGRDDGGFRVEMSFPAAPTDHQPWLILGSGANSFKSAFETYRPEDYHGVTDGIPRRIVDKMVADGPDRTVGGATSIGFAYENGFTLCYAVEPITPGQPEARRVFNGLDLDIDIGEVGGYIVAARGIA